MLAAIRPNLEVTLYEATTKKCSFLAKAASCMEIKVAIRNIRLEDLSPETFDVVTARALAPLPKLLAYAYPFTGRRTVCLFLKGQSVGLELTEAHKYWSMKTFCTASQTEPLAAIVTVKELYPRNVALQKTSRPGRRQSKRRSR